MALEKGGKSAGEVSNDGEWGSKGVISEQGSLDYHVTGGGGSSNVAFQSCSIAGAGFGCSELESGQGSKSSVKAASEVQLPLGTPKSSHGDIDRWVDSGMGLGEVLTHVDSGIARLSLSKTSHSAGWVLDKEKEMNKDDTKMENQGSLFNLPIHILLDILSRIPATTLFDCRLVCKSWLTLVRDPHLVQMHLTRVSQNENPTIIFLSYDNYHYLLDNFESSSVAVKLNLPISDDSLGVVDSCNGLEFVGSCNGLVCVMQRSDIEPIIYICNPVTGESVKLPKIYTKEKEYFPHAAFCYHPRTKEYKVFRTVIRYTDGEAEEYMMVYTVSSNSWRKVKNSQQHVYGVLTDAIINGSIHWISDPFSLEHSIVSFDFGKEEFGVVEYPAELLLDLEIPWVKMNIVVLGGCLSLCYAIDYNHAELWVMKDYGVKESWTKQFVIKDPFAFMYAHVRPLCILNNGSILLDLCWRSDLASYDLENKILRHARICKISESPGLEEIYLGIKHVYGSVTHVGSLVSLRTNCGALEGQQ